MYPGDPIPPDFDRNGPTGQLFDPILGTNIGRIDEHAGWSADIDFTAIRDNDPASPYSRFHEMLPAQRSDPASKPSSSDDDDEEGDAILLLLS